MSEEKKDGFFVLESGSVFPCKIQGPDLKVGEVVFNTNHAGYEEMATDPSYYSQILITSAPMQGNYGESDQFWESKKIWIRGFVCLEMQNTERDHSWLKKLTTSDVPVITELDTRALILDIREKGTVWGGAVVESCPEKAKARIQEAVVQEREMGATDWTKKVSIQEAYEEIGLDVLGPKMAVVDLGSKNNIIRELKKRCRHLHIIPAHLSAEEVLKLDVDGVMFSNGPGDPQYVDDAISLAKELKGQLPLVGICMGHQVLALACGAETFKMKYGHRGGNHPIKDLRSDVVYMTSQNHGYAVSEEGLPASLEVTHKNLNDQTVAGLKDREAKIFSVQFHPESCPGPNDSLSLFDEMIKQVKNEL